MGRLLVTEKPSNLAIFATMKYLSYLFSFLSLAASAQSSRVLFIGNSYTHYNDLPSMVSQMATPLGYTLTTDQSSPGGYFFQGHVSNATTLTKISAGNWDYVVLQEQSQACSFPIAQVEANTFPYAAQLRDTILLYNPCAQVVFYNTWGRKNGDASNCANWPPVCTYEGMDDLLQERYRIMAQDLNGELAAVGPVWRSLRANYPQIELYQPDESHPSYAGSYAAACTFFTVFFRADPTTITFNGNLDATTADIIRQTTKSIVFDDLSNWYIGAYEPVADFTVVPNGNNEVLFTNLSQNADAYEWNFGDGSAISTEETPTHQYANAGAYTVTLTASRCGKVSQYELLIDVVTNVEDYALPQLFQVSPVPSDSAVQWNSPVSGLYNKIQVRDQQGKIVKVMNTTANRIEIADLNSGIYYLEWWSGKQYLGMARFMKQ